MFLVDIMKRPTMKRPMPATTNVVFGMLMTSIFIANVLKFGVTMNIHAHGSFMNIPVIQFKG